LVVGRCSGGIHGRDQIIGDRIKSSLATANPNPVSETQDELPPEGLMENIQIRQHDQNPNLWWVSQGGEDVAYITHPGDGYLAWATGKRKPGQADFVGKRFGSIAAAPEAAAKSFS
jgi:hypothetical protein